MLMLRSKVVSSWTQSNCVPYLESELSYLYWSRLAHLSSIEHGARVVKKVMLRLFIIRSLGLFEVSLPLQLISSHLSQLHWHVSLMELLDLDPTSHKSKSAHNKLKYNFFFFFFCQEYYKTWKDYLINLLTKLGQKCYLTVLQNKILLPLSNVFLFNISLSNSRSISLSSSSSCLHSLDSFFVFHS